MRSSLRFVVFCLLCATPFVVEAQEVRLSSAGTRPNTFTGPGGLLLNGNYVNFLRQTAGAGRVRLRANSAPQPMVILIDGQPSGVMMPMAR